MKSRWLINLVLLALIGAIVAFLYLRPKPQEELKPETYPVSSLKLGDFKRISVEFPAKAPVVFEKVDNYWHIARPFSARADQMGVQRMLSIVAAESSDKFPATDLARFGLDKPRLKLKLDDEEFLFGTYNPVTSDQYVAYKDSVYLVPSSYADYASVQPNELIDRNLLKPTEKIAGFDLSHLEQWEASRLNLELENGQWKASAPDAKLTQNEMNEWLDSHWTHMNVKSVEPYTPDRRVSYPSFEVKLQGGGKVHFDRIEEAPDYLIGRPDEGMLYHIANDVGFAMLNPPVTLGK